MPPTWITITASGPSSIRSSISAWLVRSATLLRTSSGSGLFSTTYCDGWKDRRSPCALARAPTAASSEALSRTIVWNWGMSGWVA